MVTPIIMPRQGNTVEACIIVKWYKKKGDSVNKNEPLFGYETDKAAFDFPAPLSGTLLDTFFKEEESVPVLTTVAVIGNPGEDYASLKPTLSENTNTQSKQSVAADEQKSRPLAAVAASVAQQGNHAAGISPRARKIAAQKGVDASTLVGSGPGGRIIERDVLSAVSGNRLLTRSAAASLTTGNLVLPETGTGIGGRIRLGDLTEAAVDKAPEVNGAYEEIKLSNLRSIIASRMMQSLHETAQLTLHTSANASDMLAFRKAKKGAGFAFADLILVVFALTRVLPRFPEINSLFVGNKLRKYKSVHLALAVDTPRGLMVPVVRNAESLSLPELTTGLRTVIAKCTDGTISPDQLSGGTITVTNLGSFGIESSTPVLNPPQVAILGVNTIIPRPVYKPIGEYVVEPFIGLSLTIDHRALDGAPASQFLKALVQAIENINQFKKA